MLPVALQGMGGVGKTQVALEYVHRFKAAYDVVWWIVADPPQFVDTALADLAGRLGILVGPTLPDTVRSVLQVLGRGEPYERWLVVLDNAEELDQIEPFLPQGPGHVLLTSRNRAWGDRANPIQVDVFNRTEVSRTSPSGCPRSAPRRPIAWPRRSATCRSRWPRRAPGSLTPARRSPTTCVRSSGTAPARSPWRQPGTCR
ncbi:NB-ARC domain-containing protein [Micromonospora sp. M12]